MSSTLAFHFYEIYCHKLTLQGERPQEIGLDEIWTVTEVDTKFAAYQVYKLRINIEHANEEIPAVLKNLHVFVCYNSGLE